MYVFFRPLFFLNCLRSGPDCVHPVDVYQTPADYGARAGGDEEGAADDRIAEQFRREFMEALYERSRRKRPLPSANKNRPKEKEEPILRGPKLGGSRNSRAAMRDLILKQELEKKKR